MLISTLLSKGVGVTGKPGHFRTLFPFSVSGKTVVGLLLRRRPLYPTELRVQSSGIISDLGFFVKPRRILWTFTENIMDLHGGWYLLKSIY